jgi:BlaI family penicillinase repressor
MKRLPDTELEVMKALWASGPDTSRAQLEEALAPFRWAGNTINTYLTRLVDKGFLSVRRMGKTNLYTPQISREDYLAFDSQAVLRRLYGSSPRNFVAALARGGLDRREVDELRELLDQLTWEDDHG